MIHGGNCARRITLSFALLSAFDFAEHIRRELLRWKR
jgi:hypothetical protein